MGIAERRGREKEELRRKIMDAARTLFIEHGIEQTSMRKIADAIEYSPTAIYQHFADKETLLREICREDFDALHQAETESDHVQDPIERMRQLGMGYMRFGVQHPEQYRLMFMTRTNVQPTEEDLKRKGDPTHDGYAILRNTVVEGLRQDRFRADLTDADLISQTLWAGVHGTVAIEITMNNDPWIQLLAFEQRAGAILDVLIRGMTKEVAE